MVEFNQIYNKLVHNIKSRIDKTELPSISKKEIKEERPERVKEKEGGGLGEFLVVLRKTLKGGQEE
ncbi:MAG: hypothetical protein KDD45_09980 [Bdellovibrionales bacterium]|nr:hypothetical protein [Bdellovibrionales bacterium]